MATSNQALYYQKINDGGLVQILPADTTTKKTLMTVGANNLTIVTNIWVHSTDTSLRDIVFYVTNGGVDYPITTISVPINSGNTNAIPALSVFLHSQMPYLELDPNGNRVLKLKLGDVLKVACTTTVTAAKALSIQASGVDY